MSVFFLAEPVLRIVRQAGDASVDVNRGALRFGSNLRTVTAIDRRTETKRRGIDAQSSTFG